MLPLRKVTTFRSLTTSHQLEDSTACGHRFSRIKLCRAACKTQYLVAPSLEVKLSNPRVRQSLACSKFCAKELCCLNPGPIQSRLSAAAMPFSMQRQVPGPSRVIPPVPRAVEQQIYPPVCSRLDSVRSNETLRSLESRITESFARSDPILPEALHLDEHQEQSSKCCCSGSFDTWRMQLSAKVWVG